MSNALFISGLIKRENAKRLLYILKYQLELVKADQLMMHLLNLHRIKGHHYNELYKLKLHVFGNARKGLTNQKLDAVLLKIPICELISTWFHEFNAESSFKFIEFMSHVLYLNSAEQASVNSIA